MADPLPEIPPELQKKIKENPFALLDDSSELDGKSYKDEAMKLAFLTAADADPHRLLLKENSKQAVFFAGEHNTIEGDVRQMSATAEASYLEKLQGTPYQAEVMEKAMRNLAQRDPGAVLDNVRWAAGTPYENDVIEQAFRNAAEHNPAAVLSHSNLLTGTTYGAEVLNTTLHNAAEKAPGQLLYHLELLAGNPGQAALTEKAFRNAAQIAPQAVLDNSALLKDSSYKNEVIQQALQNEATIHPDLLLYNKNLLQDNPDKDAILEKAYRTAAEKSPGAVLDNAVGMEGKPYKDQVLETALRNAAQNSPVELLHHPELLEGKPYKDELQETALTAVATNRPSVILREPKLLANSPHKEEILEIAFRKSQNDPYTILSSLDLLKGKSYEKEILDITIPTAASRAPGLLLQHTELLAGRSDRDALFEQAYTKAAAMDPAAVIKNAAPLKGKPYEDAVLKQAFLSPESSLMPLSALPIGLQHSDASTNFALENIGLIKGKPYENEVLETIFTHMAQQSPGGMIKYAPLIDGKPFENEIWQKFTANSATQRGADMLMSAFNSAHEEPDAVRFASLRHFTPTQEYDVLTQARQNAYTSSYNGILTDMMDKLSKNHQSLTDVISPDQQQRMGVFLEAAASFNRMDEVLKFIPPDKLPGIIHDIADQAGKEQGLSSISTLSSMMIALKGNDQMRNLLEKEVKDHYDKAATPDERDRFALLAEAYYKNSPTFTDPAQSNARSPEMKSFFLGIDANPAYKLPAMNGVTADKLVDAKGVNYQLMVFSNDGDSKNNDGQNSFQNFKTTYAGKKGWKTEDHGTYIEVSSTGGKVPVHIFANKPESYQEGLDAINKEVAKRQGTDTPSFQVFVGRGHSFHAPEYIKLINDRMNLVELGSCGGYHNLEKVLEKSPDAQVIATQRTGSMFVNDPLLFDISQSINQNGSLTWSQQQKTLDHMGSDNKDSYMLPNKDLPMMILKRYKELHPEYKSPEQQERDEHMHAIPQQGGVALNLGTPTEAGYDGLAPLVTQRQVAGTNQRAMA